jgi:PKHD-type hydroxylase
MYSLNKSFTNNFFPIGFYEIKNFLTNEEIETIHEHANLQLFLKGGIMDKNEQTPSFLKYDGDTEQKSGRDSKICWLYPKNNEDIKTIYRKIFNKIIEINEEIYKFNLTDVETFQYTVYNEGQFYEKHLDLDHQLNAGNLQRKLSFSIQLSDSSEYDGGDLVSYPSKDFIISNKDKGTLIFFPSFTLHEVTPVTRGTRKSLVGWVHGPKFV